MWGQPAAVSARGARNPKPTEFQGVWGWKGAGRSLGSSSELGLCWLIMAVNEIFPSHNPLQFWVPDTPKVQHSLRTLGVVLNGSSHHPGVGILHDSDSNAVFPSF